MDGYDPKKPDIPVSFSCPLVTQSTKTFSRDREYEKEINSKLMSPNADKATGGLELDMSLFNAVTIAISGPTKGIDGLINKLGALSLSSDILNASVDAAKGDFDKVAKIVLNNAVGVLTGKVTSALLIKKGLEKYDAVVNYFAGILAAKAVDKVYTKVNEEE